jgi:hypothetical protein
MTFYRGQKVVVHQRSQDEDWEPYMEEYIGMHGIITDPDWSKNDPDALIEVSLDRAGTIRLPQDCLKLLEDS